MAKKKKYDPTFVRKILKGRKQAKEGKTTKLDIRSLWK